MGDLNAFQENKKMTADDYINWANEYRQDAEAAKRLYYKCKAKLKEHMGDTERTKLHKQIGVYFDQIISCEITAKDMEQRAEQIKKNQR